MSILTFGADPELALFDLKEQTIVPAIRKIGGSKHKPMKLEKGSVQLDGTVVEIGIDPARDADEFIANTQHVIDQVRDKLNKRFKGRYELRAGALIGYVGDVPDYALEVGCSPDFGIKVGSTDIPDVFPQPSLGNLSKDAIPLGGHIHIGFGCNLPVTDPKLLVSVRRFCSAFGKPYINSQRYPLVCRNTEFPVRIKPYGVEIRRFDPLWMADRKLINLIIENALLAEEYCRSYAGKHLVGGRKVRDAFAARSVHLEQLAAKLDPKYQKTLPLDF